MTPLAASFEVDLTPGSSLGLATTLFLLLLVAYILVRGTVAVGDKLTPMLWPSVAFFAIAVLAIVYAQARDENNDVVRFTVESDSLSVESGQTGAGGDSFSHSGASHSHDGVAEHTHP